MTSHIYKTKIKWGNR